MKKIILLILISFSSLVGYSQLPAYEGFEGATFPPTGWLVKDNRTNTGQNWQFNLPATSFPAHTGARAAYVNRENVGAGVYSEEWLITPQQTVLANGQLRFFTRQTLQGDNGTIYKVLASNSADQADLSAYTTVVAQYTDNDLSTQTADQLDYEEKIINLSFTGARYFAFVKVFTQNEAVTVGDRWLVDDVRLIQRCIDPTAPLGVTNITSTSATLTWTSADSLFQIQYGESGFNLGDGIITDPFTNTSTPRQYPILPGTLNPGTSYQFYVRAVCTDSTSEWVGPFNFGTPPLGSTCASPKVVPLLPYSDASNTQIYGNNITAASPGATGCGTTGAYLAGNDVVYSYTATATGFLNISMNPQGATNTGIFVYKDLCTNIGVSCVGGVANGNGSIRTIPALSVTNGSTYYIVISSTTATANFPYTLTIQKVTCPNPVGQPTTGIGTSTANLTWTNGAGGTANSWEVAVQPAGSGIPAGAGIQTDINTNYPAAGLQPATAYQYWVRADCGNGVFSIWSGPYLFNTSICEVVDQCNYTFTLTDSASNGWNGATMQVRQNNIVVATLGATFTSGGGPINVTVPMCNNVPFDLFWNNAGTNAGQVRISIKNSFNQTIYALTASSPELAGTSLYSQLVDCVNPLCLPPTNVTVSGIGTSNATINWTSSGVPSTAWDIYVVPAGDPAPSSISTATYPAVLGNSFLIPLNALSADTPYSVYIRSVCSVNSPSIWTTAAVNFTTLPTCPKPTNITIPTGATLTDNSFQVNWTPGTGTAWQVLVLPSPSALPLPTTGWIDTATPTLTVTAANFPAIAASTSYDVYVRTICAAGTDIGQPAGPATVQTKVCNPTAQCNYTFNVSDTFGDGWNNGILQVRQNGVVVATLTGPTDAQNQAVIPVTVPLCTGVPFDLFWSVAGNFPGEIRVSITNPFNQVLYALTAASPQLAGTVLYSDSAADCNFPKCLKPSVLYANPGINNAILGWTGAVNNTNWDVWVQLAPGTTPNAATLPTYQNIPGQTVNALSLQAGTNYVFYVRGLCAVGSPGDWVGPFAFTTLPTCPQPIDLNYVTTYADHADLIWTEVGPATNWTIIVQPSGGAVPGPGSNTDTVTTLPTVAAPYNTLPHYGVLVPGFYEFYVRSNCASDDLSTWSGPFNFLIPVSPVVCAGVEIPDTSEFIDFCPGENCVNLAATFTDSGDTTQYTVLPVAFAPPFPFTGGTQLQISTDDIWGPVFPLPFNFCFFGTNYPSVQVGSNGVLSFTTTYTPLEGGGCEWNTEPGVTVPNTQFPILNAIYGVYQDINPATATPGVTRSINYQVLGTAPCRTFVLNYLNVAQFSCGTSVGLQTSQIVLYETSNIIEVYVKDRTACPGWNEGSGVIGIQNTTGTAGYTPPGRNLGPWEAHNEAWRFTPAGPSNVAFSWLKDNATYSTNTNINVCVTETTVMTARAVYTGCGGQQATKTKTVTLRVNDIGVAPVNNVTSCDSYTLPTLAVGNYFAQPGGVQPITNPVITATQTVYVYAQTAVEPFCSDEKSFIVTIENLVAPHPADVSECLSYDLPSLEAPFNYFSQTGGVGPLTGPITQSQDVYIYGAQGLCTAESVHHVSIGSVSAVDQTDLAGCTTVVLPALPAGQTYHSQTGGNSDSLITNTTITSSQTIYIYAQSGACTDEKSFEVTISNNILPTFEPVPNICVGAPAPALPLTSQNGITGTWLPAQVQTATAGTTVYNFTPDGVLECAVPTTLSVTVDPPIVPTFNAIPDICLNAIAPALPAVSTNGITGTWTPNIITTLLAGTFTFTFTPDPGQPCTVPTTLDVTVSTQITPIFTPIPNICQNTTAPTLPLTSDNGVLGSWLPATIDITTAGTVTYIFTPALTELCAIPASITVTVDPEIIPTFTQIPNICLNDAAPALPLTSINGVTGTWSPNVINTSVAGTATYTFTPDASQLCALTATLNVTVIPPVVPDFVTTITICSGDVAPLLGNTSPNGVTGIWLPAVIDNTASGTYVFTPTPGLCAVTQTINVIVNQIVTANFAQIAPFCSGGNLPVLGTISPNGVTGTWSPALVADVSGCYVFTPNAGQCALGQTMCITVNPTITPTFDPIPSICSGSAAPVLPTTSLNGVSGTWNPATVSNTALGTTTYTFTPTPGGCATTQTLTVTVTEIPVFAVKSECQSNNTYRVYIDPDFGENNVTYSWTYNGQPIVGAATSSINVTDFGTGVGTYIGQVSIQGCSGTDSHTVSSIACIIQRGISPKGNGIGDNKNDFFDLQGMNVKQLEIFNRYGTKVYNKNNYTNEWYGQSSKGEDLPDGTYYYVIEYTNGESAKTGWIYINREQ
jgi:gliding motility-associated-like protein